MKDGNDHLLETNYGRQDCRAGLSYAEHYACLPALVSATGMDSGAPHEPVSTLPCFRLALPPSRLAESMQHDNPCCCITSSRILGCSTRLLTCLLTTSAAAEGRGFFLYFRTRMIVSKCIEYIDKYLWYSCDSQTETTPINPHMSSTPPALRGLKVCARPQAIPAG